MACKCKLAERYPLGSAMIRDECVLTDAELVNMRLHKGPKSVRIGI